MDDVDGLERAADDVPPDLVLHVGATRSVDAHDDVVAGLMRLLPSVGASRHEQGDSDDRHGEGSSAERER